MNNMNWSAMTGGLGLAVIGMLVVFSALVFLWTALSLISKFLNAQKKEDLIKKGKNETEASRALDISGETSAAIATALHLYFDEIHDQEHTILTIKRYSKNYTPWSSKIYGVMGLNKRFHRKAS